MPERKPPIVIPAKQADQSPAQRATVIFIHGLGDEGASFEDVAHQMQKNQRLPHVEWIFPNAMENRDMMTTAWYNPSGIKRVPPNRPELEEDEDEAGLLSSMDYIVSIIDDQVARGTPSHRIVVGGFSQGCALGLLTGLISKYAGQLGGIIALVGYMPLADRIQDLRERLKTPKSAHMPTFLMRGSIDQIIPQSMYALPRLEAMGYGDQVESHVYDIGHTISGPVIRDLCIWLEKVLPEKQTSTTDHTGESQA